MATSVGNIFQVQASASQVALESFQLSRLSLDVNCFNNVAGKLTPPTKKKEDQRGFSPPVYCPINV